MSKKKQKNSSDGFAFFAFLYKFIRGIVTVAFYVVTWFFCLLILATMFGIIVGIASQDFEDIGGYIFSVVLFTAIIFVLWMVNRKVVGNVIAYFILGGWGLPQGYVFLSSLIGLVLAGVYQKGFDELNGWVFLICFMIGFAVSYYPFKKFTISYLEKMEQKEQEANQKPERKMQNEKKKQKKNRKRGAV